MERVSWCVHSLERRGRTRPLDDLVVRERTGGEKRVSIIQGRRPIP